MLSSSSTTKTLGMLLVAFYSTTSRVIEAPEFHQIQDRCPEHLKGLVAFNAQLAPRLAEFIPDAQQRSHCSSLVVLVFSRLGLPHLRLLGLRRECHDAPDSKASRLPVQQRNLDTIG